MNKVTLIGRLVKDAELKYVNDNVVANFTLAVNRKYKKDGQPSADFIPIMAWNKLAENVNNYTGKGLLISVSGRIQTSTYETKDGTKRNMTTIVAEEIQFIEWKNKNS